MAEWTRIVFIGIAATVVMDLWALAARNLFGIATLDYRLVGRWIAHFGQGRFAHDAIALAEPVKGEKWLGWAAHYAIGLAFAWLFALLVVPDWFANPTPEVAVMFGLVTVLVPWLIMQPAFGFGVAASNTPDPLSARLRNLATHAVFGLGLYLSALVLGQLGA